MATVFWGVYSVLLVGFKPLGSTVKAVAYQKTLKAQAKGTRMLTKVLLSHLLTSWGWEILTHPPQS